MSTRAFFDRLFGVRRAELMEALADLPDEVLTQIAQWAAGGQPAPLADDDVRWSPAERHAVHRLREAAKRYLERPF